MKKKALIKLYPVRFGTSFVIAQSDTKKTARLLQGLVQRIERGVGLLDRHISKWPELIDLEKFEFDSVSACVIGQVMLRRINGLLDRQGDAPNERFTSAIRLLTGRGGLGEPYGFWPPSPREVTTQLLGDLWAQVIRLRTNPKPPQSLVYKSDHENMPVHVPA